VITIPVFLPIIEAMKFDPIWFWCLFIINITIGGITPPFGLRLFTLKAVAPSISLSEIDRASIPFVFLILLGMGIIVIFPQIVVWLPNLSIK
jgi:TRAP-type C4-dicarboxylate transport system permease large subunit